MSTLIAAAALAPIAGGHPVGTELLQSTTDDCGGEAPEEHACATGRHVALLDAEHQVFAGDDFTGRITSTMRQALGEAAGLVWQANITCTVRDGDPQGCIRRSMIPAAVKDLDLPPYWKKAPVRGVPFQHSCTAGGIGPGELAEGFWRCEVSHD